MRCGLTMFVIAIALTAANGCVSPALVEPPDLVGGKKIVVLDENPVYIPLGSNKEAYAKVFETVLQVLADYSFEILESNRFDGRIETVPRVAPGVGLFMKPGSPDIQERVLATLQTYRHRISIRIDTADNGGYFIEVVARKELQDLPQPVRQTAGAAVFRNYNTVERQFEVVDANFYEGGWIFKGRDPALEQKIIQALKKHI